jgi:hypothetical protein
MFIGVSRLGRVQIGNVPPVPGGTDCAVDQHGSRAHHLGRVGHELSENLPDQRAQQVPAPAHRGLAHAEDRTSEGLGEVPAQHTHHQRHRAEQAQRIRATPGGEPTATSRVYPVGFQKSACASDLCDQYSRPSGHDQALCHCAYYISPS